MAQSILDNLAKNEPSICIPRVHKSFSDGLIIDGIQQLGFGEVEKVDMINKTTPDGIEYYMAFIHFKSWNTDDETNTQRIEFESGKKLKVTYDEDSGAYWILGKSYAKRRDNKSHTKRCEKGKNKPYVDMDGWTNIPSRKTK